jgi:hypothetical protein
MHDLIKPPRGELANFQDGGVWVQGVDKPVKVKFNEFHVYWKDPIHFERSKHKPVRTK